MRKQITKRAIVGVSMIALTMAVMAGAAGCAAADGGTAKKSSAASAVSAANSVYGPSLIKGNKQFPLEEVCIVQNKSGCTNLGSMCIDGKTLYCIKTKNDNTIAELFRIDSFASNSRAVTSWNNTGLSHANGLTCLNGNLYVATMLVPDPTDKTVVQIWKMSESGAKTEAYRSDKDTIYSISRFVGNTFLVGLGGTDARKKEYAVAELSNGKITLTQKFYVDQLNAFGTGQDIAYFGGCLYVPTWNGTNGNRILKIKIGESVTDGKQYEPDEIIELNATDLSVVKLEVESLDVDENGKTVVCTNYETATNKDTDMIFRLPM